MRMLQAMVVVLALAAAGCAAPVESAPQAQQDAAAVSPEPPNRRSDAVAAPVEEGVTRVITADQAGSTVEVTVGERFAVALVGVPTAGYLWAPTALPPFLTRAGEGGGPTSAAQSQPGFAGGNHWEVFYFAATEPGEGALTLAQRRPWETNEPPSQTLSVTIRAR